MAESRSIDCIEFKPNNFGVEKLYFDVHRRFEVGCPRSPEKDVEDDIVELLEDIDNFLEFP